MNKGKRWTSELVKVISDLDERKKKGTLLGMEVFINTAYRYACDGDGNVSELAGTVIPYYTNIFRGSTTPNLEKKYVYFVDCETLNVYTMPRKYGVVYNNSLWLPEKDRSKAKEMFAKGILDEIVKCQNALYRAKTRYAALTSEPRVIVDLIGYLTIEQYAGHVGRPIATVKTWINRNRLDVVKVEGTTYISEDANPRVRAYRRKATA